MHARPFTLKPRSQDAGGVPALLPFPSACLASLRELENLSRRARCRLDCIYSLALTSRSVS